MKNIYYELNKERKKEYNKKRVICSCGIEISQGAAEVKLQTTGRARNKTGHKKSTKHLLLLNL